PAEISNRFTAPGGSPAMLVLGTAAKAVMLSVHTKKLSLGPCSGKLPETDSCGFATTARRLSPGLNTKVRSRLGLTAIMPALLTLLLRERSEMANRASRSLDASTISIPGDPPPNWFGSKGLETKALKLNPLCVAALGVL